ncbi:MAG: hypothetical protein EXS40_04120 [Opitutaceae bacterium]|nr:hypothetical protein [Opitutaceae bacterium]
MPPPPAALRLFKLLLTLALAGRAGAAVVNVSTTAALQTAVAKAAAGDVIVLADGTYSNTTLSVPTAGITVRSATPGGVFLQGTNAITISGDGVVFSGFQFTSGSIPGVVITVTANRVSLTQLNFNGYSAQKYVNLQGQYDEVAYCNFENKPASAPAGNLVHIDPGAGVANYARIHHCSFRNLSGPGGDNGNECIRIANGSQSASACRTTVEYCLFTNTGGGDSEAISVKSRENVLRYNTFRDNPNAMMVFRNGDDNVAYGNVFLSSGGIRVKEANNIYCYNNYFERAGVGGSTNAVQYLYVSPNLRNVHFVHNTFYECGLIDLSSGASANVWANNLFQKSSGPIFTGSPAGITWSGNLYAGTLGVSIPSGVRSAGVKLVLNGVSYYGLPAGSPAIGAASSAYPAMLDVAGIDDDPALLLDVAGKARPASPLLKDVGADQYGADAVTNRPLTLANVGPSYLGGPATGATSPVITVQPAGFVATAWTSGALSVQVSGTPTPALQWSRDGAALAGATGATLSFASLSGTQAGLYTVTVTNSLGLTASAAAVVTVLPAMRIINLSVLTALTDPADSVTLGYVVGNASAAAPLPVVIRAGGPSLTALGVAGVLADPRLSLYVGDVQTGTNDNWAGTASLKNGFLSVGAFPFAPDSSRDAAALATITSRDNSVRVDSADRGTGLVIAEVYDANATGVIASDAPRLINVSVLRPIGTSLTLGFVLSGSATRRILVRAVGPSLGTLFNVPGVMADPRLELFDGAGRSIGVSDNWGGGADLTAAFIAAGSFALPAGSADAALTATLRAGNYSVVVTPASGANGIGLVEVYELP